jgi:hypothetical protein
MTLKEFEKVINKMNSSFDIHEILHMFDINIFCMYSGKDVLLNWKHKEIILSSTISYQCETKPCHAALMN